MRSSRDARWKEVFDVMIKIWIIKFKGDGQSMRANQIFIEGIDVALGSYLAILEFLSYEEPRTPWNISSHSHKSFEFHFVGAGRGRLVTDHGEFELSDGVMFITGPGVVHSQKSEAKDSMDEFSLTMKFIKNEQSDFEEDYSTDKMIEYMLENPFYIEHIDLGCREMIHTMMNELLGKLPGWKDKVRAVFTELMMLVLRHISSVGEAPEALNTPKTERVGGMNYRARLERYLLRFENPDSEELLAKKLSISRRHLGRLMQKYYGMTYAERISSLRVESAKRMLVSTDASITEIAQAVGFSTVQYFIRVFGKIEGVSPGAYRREARRTKQKNTDRI